MRKCHCVGLLLISTVCVLAAEGTIIDGKYTTIDKAVTVTLPADTMPDGVKDRSDGKGISCQAIVFHKDKAITGIYTTKIRKQFPKTDAVLMRIAARFRQNIQAEDGSSLEFLKFTQLGDRKVLVAVVRHIERGKPVMLTDKWLKKGLRVNCDVIEARFYFVHQGYFVEFKQMVIPELPLNAAKLNENEVAQAALRRLCAFVCRSSVLSKHEAKLFGEFQFADEYVRGIFKDPSIELTEKSNP